MTIASPLSISVTRRGGLGWVQLSTVKAYSKNHPAAPRHLKSVAVAGGGGDFLNAQGYRSNSNGC